ncbi:ABC transporter permease [Saccharopolyspora phatthalungensis]|uniref:NitT/TauT family transport system permease protein n=1 Tax=Saccharopolyspora phatthalungensis TaxID=664693 RepID=A0A840Q1K5_9PSEU|nr:ABC transporter permease subunit [Saccharopolyspora phatthalungensis]MBB5153840.1 NitT/TauT family transport system permease protein [Saccharopolyspora phatthalungensis]
MTRTLRGLIGLAGFLLAWEVFSRSGIVPQQYLPPPSTVLTRFVELLGDRAFLLDLIASVLAWAIALGIAIAIAVPAGLLLGSVPWIRSGTRAIIEFLRPIPSVALIPLAIVLVGAGPETKITLAVYAAVWPILFNTIYALDEIDPVMVDTARSFGFGRGRVMCTVALPSAAPFVLTGIRMSAAVALILVVSTEFLAGGGSGLGSFVLDASTGAGRMDLVLAGTLVAGIVGYLSNEALELVHKRAFRWSAVDREAG